METNFSHEQSLTLISEMINRARNNVRMKGAYTLVFWGYVVATLAIINSLLLQKTGKPELCGYIWIAMVPAGVVSYFIERRDKHETLVKTHIDKISDMIWFGFFIGAMVMSAIIFTVAFKYGLLHVFNIITPAIITMLGISQFATACVYRSYMWYVIATVSWVGAIACAFSSLEVQFIIFAACVVVGLIIPGHILIRQAKNSNV